MVLRIHELALAEDLHGFPEQGGVLHPDENLVSAIGDDLEVKVLGVVHGDL